AARERERRSIVAPAFQFCREDRSIDKVRARGGDKSLVSARNGVDDFVAALAEEPPADLLDRLARAAVVLADDEDDARDEAEGVGEHERFDLAVDGAAPELALGEGPADLDLALLRFQVAVSRAADDPSRGAVDDGEGALRGDGAVGVALEHLRLPAVGLRMLLPDERIARRAMERVEVVGPQRAEVDERAAQRRLEIEGRHAARVPSF